MEDDNDKFVLNNFYTDNYFKGTLVPIAKAAFKPDELEKLFNQTKALFSKNLASLSEAMLEEELIKPVLKDILGYQIIVQDEQTIQGINLKPDYALFTSAADKERYLNNKNKIEAEKPVMLLCEAKAYNVNLNRNENATVRSPYRQLLDYLSYFNLWCGFLTNGQEWQMIDISERTNDKKAVIFNLAAIVAEGNLDFFALFCYLLGVNSYRVTSPGQKSVHEKTLAASKQAEIDLKESLKDTIFGDNGQEISVFTEIGHALYRAYPSAKLELIYNSSIYFLFRLLFIAFFEDKNHAIMSQHSHYPSIALWQIIAELNAENALEQDEYYYNQRLFDLFEILDQGKPVFKIPLLNGGLFAQSPTGDAQLLNDGYTLFTNKLLQQVFRALFFQLNSHGQNKQVNFRLFNTRNLGELYEGLLSCRFSLAEEELHYVEFKEKGKSALCYVYLDSYDYARFKVKNPRKKIIAKGAFYMDKGNFIRKQTGSYYTPQNLSSYLAKQAVTRALGAKAGAPLELKILDPACGSGHLLLDVLSELTTQCLQNEALLAQLRPEIAAERAKIEQNLVGFKTPVAIEDELILKRMLMKKAIYGIDINSFSVEITRLALWLETFIFGTPLSLIEHHIVCGNALVGSSIAELNALFATKDTLYEDAITNKINYLQSELKRLNTIQDTTAAEIAQSKQLMAELKPLQQELNQLLNTHTIIKLEEARLALLKGAEKTKAQQTLNSIISQLRTKPEAAEALVEPLERAQSYASYQMLNVEVSFAEVFSRSQEQAEAGFDIIIMNPPWEKTRFEEPMFFSQYNSRYRQFTNAQKAEYRTDQLGKGDINKRYNHEKTKIELLNSYYKQTYRLNDGFGPSNLYRFFAERALQLARAEGVVNLVCPTALLTDDGSTSLRKALATAHPLVYAISFENRAGNFFPDVHKSYKFSLVQIDKTPLASYAANPANHPTKLAFRQTAKQLETDTLTWLTYPFSLGQQLSAHTLSFLEFQHQDDVAIFSKALALFKPIASNWLDFKTDLGATIDKDLFLLAPTATTIPLYKGACIHHYRHNYNLTPETLQYVEAAAFAARKPTRCYQAVRLAYRKVASSTNQRTFICALLPAGSTAQDGLWLSEPSGNLLTELFFMAVANSLVFDYLLRFVVDINVNKNQLQKIPLPQPSVAELSTNTSYQALIKNAALLTLSYDAVSFNSLIALCQLDPAQIPTTPKQREALLIANDCLVAELYGLTKAELNHIASPTYFNALNNTPEGANYLATLRQRYGC